LPLIVCPSYLAIKKVVDQNVVSQHLRGDLQRPPVTLNQSCADQAANNQLFFEL
jgi:hypothetical protein